MGATVASGDATARAFPPSSSSKTLGITPSAVGQQIAWWIGGLTAGTKYPVKTNGLSSTVTADSSGTVASTLTATGTTEVQIAVSTKTSTA